MVHQDIYQKAILFATAKHHNIGQTVPGTNLPYLVHLSNVAMEIIFAAHNSTDFDTDFAIQLALLHDTLEDTETTYEELTQEFSYAVADGVLALSKNKSIAKDDRLNDSIERILLQPKEVWSVKLADRITNLQPPPSHWTPTKISQYHAEAQTILEKLKGGNQYLEDRLGLKIQEYKSYF
ncbi:MAG: bifunctional (p)ppGpp synthetase/guanosine-3',5'-bis(diphosphate) 3'-pyrophosphohydrolase [Saprospiraceae bacterium]|nr:bifunctional (p)ppGpp synthetase/guanosine-3',5'-bis(diphosphate) 3'-pyrophosphohydrolase [Saprospiraceae bacterium]MBP6565702.1 bifunctional (p)ppGpp synthetase/guanosine-3',5'-bis(diphosphate) 3'-pyrophosphohydrolase [Saprospiraceae bacterium]